MFSKWGKEYSFCKYGFLQKWLIILEEHDESFFALFVFWEMAIWIHFEDIYIDNCANWPHFEKYRP